MQRIGPKLFVTKVSNRRMVLPSAPVFDCPCESAKIAPEMVAVEMIKTEHRSSPSLPVIAASSCNWMQKDLRSTGELSGRLFELSRLICHFNEERLFKISCLCNSRQIREAVRRIVTCGTDWYQNPGNIGVTL